MSRLDFFHSCILFFINHFVSEFDNGKFGIWNFKKSNHILQISKQNVDFCLLKKLESETFKNSVLQKYLSKEWFLFHSQYWIYTAKKITLVSTENIDFFSNQSPMFSHKHTRNFNCSWIRSPSLDFEICRPGTSFCGVF